MKVFVYGTLRPGQRLWPGVENYVETYIEDVTIQGDLFMSTGWYPVMKEGEGTIKGTLLVIKKGEEEDALNQLDAIEGYPWLYNRMEVETSVRLHGMQENVTAWVYVGNNAILGEQIPDGDFVGFTG